jgi:hypothetical protein
MIEIGAHRNDDLIVFFHSYALAWLLIRHGFRFTMLNRPIHVELRYI